MIGALDARCRGTGFLRCLCAGDFCICDFHGQAECPGCVDCEWSDEDRGEYPEPEWDDDGPSPSGTQ